MAENSLMHATADTSIYRLPEQPNMLTQLSTIASLRNAVTQNEVMSQGLAERRNSIIHNELATLATHQNPTMDDVSTVADRLKRLGVPSTVVDPEIQNIAKAGGTPEAIKAIAAHHLAASLDPQGRYNAAYGTMQTRSLGGKLQTVIENPMRGTVEPAGGTAAEAQLGMSPGEENRIESMTGPEGQPVNRTHKQNVDIVTGRSALNGAFAGRGAQPGAKALPGGGVLAPGPNFEPGLKALNEDKQNASAKIQGVQPLINAMPLLSQLTTSAAGPGSQAFNKIKSGLITAGILPPNVSDAAVRQEAQKYLNQYVAKSSIAGRSDLGTLTSQAASPNLETSLPATLELTRNAIAADRMEAARPIVYGNRAPDGYLDHKATFLQNEDRRAYMIDQMEPAARQKILNDMLARQKAGDKEAGRFFKSLNNAHMAIYNTGSSSNGQ